MNQPQNPDHYPSISDDILVDSGAVDPVYQEIYSRLKGFDLGSTNAWTVSYTHLTLPTIYSV